MCTVGRDAEMVYEATNCGVGAYNIKFSNQSWGGNSDLTYCDACQGSSNLFGCVSLRSKNYCILNKQYTKEEYEALVPKIIEHMKSTGEYGEFFPTKLSLFSYNETSAQDHFPLSKEQALAQGFLWKDQEEKNVTIGGDILACAHEGKCTDHCTVGFKVIKAELDFYQKMQLPIPKLCPNCRHYERLAQRNPLKLWKRQCMCDKNHPQHNGKCPIEFETSYAPDKPEIIYCEQCYQAEVI